MNHQIFIVLLNLFIIRLDNDFKTLSALIFIFNYTYHDCPENDSVKQ